MATKMHLLDTTTPPSRSHPEWVKHTQTLCGREFHLHSSFLAKVKPDPEQVSIICKTCLAKYNFIYR